MRERVAIVFMTLNVMATLALGGAIAYDFSHHHSAAPATAAVAGESYAAPSGGSPAATGAPSGGATAAAPAPSSGGATAATPAPASSGGSGGSSGTAGAQVASSGPA